MKPRSPTFAEDEEKEEELSIVVMMCVVDAAGFAVEIDPVSAIADAAAVLVRGRNV